MLMMILSSSVLILLMLCLRPFLKKRFSPILQYALWGLVALRLLIPIQLWHSPLSLENFTQREPAPIVEPQENLTNNSFQAQPSVSIPQEDAPNFVNIPQNNPQPSVTLPDTQNKPLTQTVTPQKASLTTEEILNSLWFAGCLGMALWFLCLNVGFTRKARQGARRLESPETTIPVYESEHIPSPCLVGLVKPRIYMLPCGDPSAQRHILAHEQTHYRHRDHIWSLVRILCLCIHWFNPLVWVAAYLSKEDCEAACDQGSIAVLGEEERISYGKTLLDTLTRVKLPANLLRSATTMGGGKAQIRKRMERIVSKPKKALWAVLILVVVLSLCVGCTFTGATDPNSQNLKEDIGQTLKTYDFDLFSIQLPESLQKSSSSNANSVEFVSSNRRIGVALDFFPRYFSYPELSDFALNMYKTFLGEGGISTSSDGNLCFQASFSEGVRGYYVCLEAGHYYMLLSLYAREKYFETYLSHFEAWEASIVWNDEPTGSLLSELYKWETDDIEIKVPLAFFKLKTSDEEDYLLLSNTSYVYVEIYTDSLEKREGVSSLAHCAESLQENGFDVSKEDIAYNAAGHPFYVYTTNSEEGRGYTYTVYVETPTKFIVVDFEASEKMYEEYLPLFEEWAATIVVKDSFGIRVVDYINEGNIRIPQFVSKYSYCEKANGEIRRYFENNPDYESIDYSVSRAPWVDDLWGDIEVLSLLITAETVDGETVYAAYNVNLQSGDKILLPYIADQRRCEIFARELYHRYNESTGSLPYTEEDHARLLQNLNHTNSVQGDLSRDTVHWLTEDGQLAASFIYYPLDGGEPYRYTTVYDDSPCDCAATQNPRVIELYCNTADGSENHIPFLIMSGTRAEEINGEILRYYGQRAIGTTFSWSIHDEILSLAVHGQDALIFREMHHAYALSTRTLRDASRAEVLAAAGMTEEEYNAVAGAMFEDQFFHLFLGGGNGQVRYPSESSEIIEKSGTPENVADSIPYLEKDGSLWAYARIYQIAGSSSSWYPVPISNHQFTEGYQMYQKVTEGYPCEIRDCVESSETYGKATLHLPLWSNIWQVKDVQVIRCEDGCEPSALVSKAAYGNAPVYAPKLQEEFYGDDYRTFRFQMTVPEAMVEDLKNSGSYDAVVEELERNVYFLLVVDKTHYAYLHLECSEADEYTAQNAIKLVKGVTIVLE